MALEPGHTMKWACNYTTGFNYMCIFIVYVNLLLQTNWKPLLTRERGLQSSWVHHVSVSTLVRPSWSKMLRTEAQASIPSSSGSRRRRKRPRLPLPPLLSISRPWWAKSTGRSRAITWKHVCRAPHVMLHTKYQHRSQPSIRLYTLYIRIWFARQCHPSDCCSVLAN